MVGSTSFFVIKFNITVKFYFIMLHRSPTEIIS